MSLPGLPARSSPTSPLQFAEPDDTLFGRRKLRSQAQPRCFQRFSRIRFGAFPFRYTPHNIERLIMRVVEVCKITIGVPCFRLHPCAGLSVIVFAELPTL